MVSLKASVFAERFSSHVLDIVLVIKQITWELGVTLVFIDHVLMTEFVL